MTGKSLNLQDQFLNAMRRERTPATLFLVKGVKLQGVVTWFDAFSLLLRREGQSQLVYKHAVSTILPARPLDGFAPAVPDAASQPGLQDLFLAASAREATPATLYLINGVMLQGAIGGFDQFSLILVRDGQAQLVYKHAVATIQPEAPLPLHEAEAE